MDNVLRHELVICTGEAICQRWAYLLFESREKNYCIMADFCLYEYCCTWITYKREKGKIVDIIIAIAIPLHCRLCVIPLLLRHRDAGGPPPGAGAPQVAPDHNTGGESKANGSKDQAHDPIGMPPLGPVPPTVDLL